MRGLFMSFPLCCKFLDFSTEAIVRNEVDFPCGKYNRFLPFSIHPAFVAVRSAGSAVLNTKGKNRKSSCNLVLLWSPNPPSPPQP
jgi:hypothetical protein